MKIRSLTRLMLMFVLSCIAGGTSMLRADTAGPDTVLKEAVEEVIAVAFTKEITEQAGRIARIRPILDKVVDFPAITRRAIGPAWAQLNAEEQQRAVVAFSALVVKTYGTHLEGETRPQISYDAPSHGSADRCEIATRVTYDGRMFRVSYRLHRLPDGWRVYDIIVEGVSLIANYRAQFAALAQKGGGNAVLGALESKDRK